MIHQYKLNGYNIVLDIASGSVHNVDEVAYDTIGLYEDHTHEEITEILLKKYADQPDVTADEIAEGMTKIFAVDRGQALADVRALISKMQAAGILLS